ncbi:MAG: hypothetical protein Q8R37_05660 [Nanoarchaeota archaeon]|nr:hypothetical protein [Nanoarchaeota archaeon]
MNNFVETITTELKSDKKIKVIKCHGPYRIAPSRRMEDMIPLLLDRDKMVHERWTEVYGIIVAPATGRYSQPLLQEFLEGLLPHRQPVEQRDFIFYKVEKSLKYGSKTFEEKVGEEITTIETRLETANDLTFFNTGTKKRITPIYQTVGVILCPDYSLACKASRLQDLECVFPNPFSIHIKNLQKLDPNYKPRLMERLFG